MNRGVGVTVGVGVCVIICVGVMAGPGGKGVLVHIAVAEGMNVGDGGVLWRLELPDAVGADVPWPDCGEAAGGTEAPTAGAEDGLVA